MECAVISETLPLLGATNLLPLPEALAMLDEIGTPERIPEYIARAKDKSDPDGDQMQHLRHSMPRSAFAFVIIDSNTREILEYSDFLHRRRNFKDSDMPSHFTTDDVKEFRGQYPSLPYNGEAIQMALKQVKDYQELLLKLR